MKKLVIIALLFLGVFVNAQETEAEKQARGIELMSKKVDMTVDSELFMSVTQNTYVSESPKAVVMGMYVPENYEAAKKKLKENASTQNFEITSSGEKEINGIKVLYMYGNSEAEGVKLNNKVYCYEIDKDTCLMLVGMLEVGANKKYSEAIDSALNSGIKK
ncbi:MAG: hypothetical protein CMO82_06605 [Winogradskyella sp.]|nr:hypothetical protein [Winogradskyella sp.]|tara:strand:- start:29 stop:511 length:483 start_codon:yes stop_codon:yes gene_type:complete